MYPSRNWKATGIRPDTPGSEATLRVSGTIDLPTPAHTAKLVDERDGINPDINVLRVEVVEPEPVVSQDVTPRDVEWEGSVRPTITHAQVLDYETIAVDWQ